ncbi:MAG: outer membrane protein transport protein [Ignavibacteriaceae bacterium]|nr:outer membrane protein transport protein [Ignavibacteriaceae bacterium]
MKKISLLCTLFVLMMFGNTFAGGFQINEHGARAMAMGGAFTAMVNDPSSLYFNVAGMAGLRGWNATVGTTLIAPAASFRGPSPSIAETEMEKQLFPPSHLYLTYEISDGLVAGLSVNNPFGLGTRWSEDWVGRFSSIEADLQTFSFQPSIAYKVMDNLSVGVGLLYNLAHVKLDRAIGFAPFQGEGTILLEGSESGAFGYHIGVAYQPFSALSLGLSYKSEVEYAFEGTATTTGVPAALTGRVPEGDIEATFVSPQQFVFGLGYQVTKDLLITADYQFVGWSSYDSLKVDFKNAAYTDLASARLYEDTYILRFGAEYAYNQTLDLRCGFLIDNNPVPDEMVDPSLPDSDRLGFSFGFGYQLTNTLSLDASYLYLRFAERTITNSDVNYASSGFAPLNGTYNSTGNLFSVTFNYSF